MTSAVLVLVPSLYLLMASAETVTQCSSAENRTCEQECPSGEPPCNLSCQAASEFDACEQTCTAQEKCDDLHCKDAHNCTQSCFKGQCDRVSCDNISRSCEQDCTQGSCNATSCVNTTACNQKCTWAKCDELSCSHTANCRQDCHLAECADLSCDNVSTRCEQDCGWGECEQANCTNSATCKQDCSSARACDALSCDNITTKCEQMCRGADKCARLSCNNVTTCIQDCDAAHGCGKMICKNSDRCEQIGNSEEMKCEADVRACKQESETGADTLSQNLYCGAETCNQTCVGENCAVFCNGNTCAQTCTSVLFGQCTMRCSADVKECSQTCRHAGRCLVQCASANCKLDCRDATCLDWCDVTGDCPTSTPASPTSICTSLVPSPSGFVWLAYFLLFN